jgi:hypothetical protein
LFRRSLRFWHWFRSRCLRDGFWRNLGNHNDFWLRSRRLRDGFRRNHWDNDFRDDFTYNLGFNNYFTRNLRFNNYFRDNNGFRYNHWDDNNLRGVDRINELRSCGPAIPNEWHLS